MPDITTSEIKPRRTRLLFNAFTITPGDITQARKNAELGKPERYFEILDHIRTLDGDLRGDLETRRLALLSFDYRVMGEDEAQVEFVKDVITRLDYQSLASALADGVYFGIRVLDLEWEKLDGKILPTHFDTINAKYLLSAVPADTKTGQGNPASSHIRSIADVLYYRNTDQNLIRLSEFPTGKLVIADFSDVSYKHLPINFTEMGLGALCMYASILQHYNLLDWGAFNEIFGQPLRVAQYPSGHQVQDEITKAEEAVKSLATDAYAVLSDAIKIVFPEVNRTSSVETYDKLDEKAAKKKTRAILGETLTADSGGTGSYALGMVHNGVRLEKVVSDAHYIKRVIKRQIIDPLLAYNFAKPDYSIAVDIPVKASQNLASEILVDREAYEMGMELSKSQMRAKYGWRVPADDADKLIKPAGSGLSALLGQ